MIDFEIYVASTKGDSKNCIYNDRIHVVDETSFKKAIAFDHVCAKYKNNYRSNDNFEWTNVLPQDCDNDHSDNPDDWKYPLDVALAFPDCRFLVSYSRNHMKPKNGKCARPKFHVYFPIPIIKDGQEYAKLKQRIQQFFPEFDAGALGQSRFLYGTDKPQTEIFQGRLNVVEYLDRLELDAFAQLEDFSNVIQNGSRNATMSRNAARFIIRFGNTDEAYQRFLKEADKCVPPLEDSELTTIWNSAVKFGNKIASNPNYIPPELFDSKSTLKPDDYSDVGQARVLSHVYANALCYSPATDFMIYNGQLWEESKPKAQAIAQELTDRQLEESRVEIEKARKLLEQTGALKILDEIGPKKGKEAFDVQQQHAYQLLEIAEAYQRFAIKRRESKSISAALKEVRPMVEIHQGILDKDEFKLNTPIGTYDLVHSKMNEHRFDDFITKQTSVCPSQKGMDIWNDTLEVIFQGDKELIEYVQKIVGLSSIGKVYVEALIIAYGEGRNGKSTFWNAIARVLGTYSGNISADVLTVGCKRNVKPELAEAKGKRLLIAAELQEGMRLNTSNVKQLCSTDEIYAEKKYKDPFSYVPSHTLVLYTNHLPKVGATDKGTWRRLIVIPFNATIEGKNDIKNYADFLVENAGEAILQWIVDGAKKVIDDNYQIQLPQSVKNAIHQYKENNDWLGQFFEDCCVIEKTAVQKSGEFYSEYRAYCLRNGEFARSTTDFYTALENENFTRKKTAKGMLIHGIRLKNEFE